MFDEKFLLSLPRLSQGPDLAVDVYVERGNVIAKMNLPGMRPEEIDVTLDKNVLTVSGKREEEKEIRNKGYYSKEIRRGSFSRTVQLPRAVQTGRAEAHYEDGVLRVVLPVERSRADKAVKVKVQRD